MALPSCARRWPRKPWSSASPSFWCTATATISGSTSLSCAGLRAAKTPSLRTSRGLSLSARRTIIGSRPRLMRTTRMSLRSAHAWCRRICSRENNAGRASMNVMQLPLAAALIAMGIPHALAGETLKIASPQRGSWEGAIPELGKQAGIFEKHGLDLEILYTQGGGERLQIVISGAVDIGLSARTLGTLGAYAKGAPMRIIAASSTGSQEKFWFVPAN